MLYIVTHNDLDGVASAAIYLSMARKYLGLNDEDVEIHFVEPNNILNLLTKSIKVDMNSYLVFTDLGMNSSNITELSRRFKELVKNGVKIEWYDHHVWDESWISVLKNIGVNLYIDKQTCGAGVVHKYSFPNMEREECHSLLVDIVCGADLWSWDNHLSPLMYRATRMPRGSRGDNFRRFLINEFSNCRLFSDNLIERAEELLDSELDGYKKLVKETSVLYVCNNNKVGILYRELDHPGISLSANYLIGRLNLDLAVIIKPDGSISFRSKRGIARRYALCFGGGGHPNASGGRLELSFIYTLLSLIPFLRKKLLINNTIRRLTNCCDNEITT